jgi:hypothetical protein
MSIRRLRCVAVVTSHCLQQLCIINLMSLLLRALAILICIAASCCLRAPPASCTSITHSVSCRHACCHLKDFTFVAYCARDTYAVGASTTRAGIRRVKRHAWHTTSASETECASCCRCKPSARTVLTQATRHTNLAHRAYIARDSRIVVNPTVCVRSPPSCANCAVCAVMP